MGILKKEICFLSKDKIYCNRNQGNFNKELILSPYYYWHFEKKLPVTNIKRAKKIIPQILESSLPNKDLKYIIIQKEKNQFEIFVLDILLLKDKLKSLNIPHKLVQNISFSHLEFINSEIQLDNAILVSTGEFASEINIDKAVSTNLPKSDINSVLKSKNKLEYRHSLDGESLTQKSIDFLEANFIALVFIFIFFITSLGIDIYSNKILENKYTDKKQELFSSQKYATHELQLSYIMDNFLELDSKYKSFRNDFKKILGISANQKSYINSIEYEDGQWLLHVKSATKGKADSLLNKTKLKYIKKQKDFFVYEKSK